ncbi:MAG: hypothetical protein ACJAUG_003303 [Halioglobus sp.]|jgi:hypothetical protein
MNRPSACPINLYGAVKMEKRTARLTLLVDPDKKATFEKLCESEDVTPSQKIRQFMRDYIEQKLGENWRDEVFNGD